LRRWWPLGRLCVPYTIRRPLPGGKEHRCSGYLRHSPSSAVCRVAAPGGKCRKNPVIPWSCVLNEVDRQAWCNSSGNPPSRLRIEARRGKVGYQAIRGLPPCPSPRWKPLSVPAYRGADRDRAETGPRDLAATRSQAGRGDPPAHRQFPAPVRLNCRSRGTSHLRGALRISGNASSSRGLRSSTM
jgi:hypothetical protein